MTTKKEILDVLAGEKAKHEAAIADLDARAKAANLLVDGTSYPEEMLPVSTVPSKSLDQLVDEAVREAMPSQAELAEMIATEIEAQVPVAVEAAIMERVRESVSRAVVLRNAPVAG